MPKRPHRECNEDRWRRKIKEYEAKLITKKRRRVIYSSDTDSDDARDVQIEEHPDIPDYDTEPEIQDRSRTLSAPSPSPPPPSPPPPTPPPPSPPPLSSPDPAPAVDPDLLLALGDSQKDTPEWGEEIVQDISQRWEPILKQGLKKDVKEELFNKYLYPKNVPLAKPPILNPEISTMLTDPSRNRDKRVSSKQSQLGRAIAALGKVMSGILTKSMANPEIVRTLNDVGKLVADSHYLETDTRRSLITPLLDKSYVTPFKDRQRDSFLFGENLGEFIKSSRGIKKTGQLITPPAPSTSSANLNWKGPPRQQQTNRQLPAQRSGGQRAAAPAPRRARAPPPPPPPPPGASRRPAATASTSRSRRGMRRRRTGRSFEVFL